ncbi:MAG TPA: PAS domain S-box protein [Rhodocyclaceae bacterium]|nr:PAS domain S-box protein [Rhodocyclaceae bacterium]
MNQPISPQGHSAQARFPEHLASIQLRQIFEHAPIGMALLDLQGHWLDVNAQFCRMVGYGREELLQLAFRDITASVDVQGDDVLLAQLIGGEISSYQREKRYVRKDGQSVWVELAVSLARNAQGEPDYLITQIVDINELKLAHDAVRERELTLEAVLGALPVGVRLADARGHVVSANMASLEIWCGAGGEMLHEGVYRAWDAATGTAFTDADWPLQRAFATGQGVEAQLLDVLCFDDTPKTLLCSVLPIVGDKDQMIGAIEVMQDMTRWLKLEQQLMVRTRELESRNKELEQFAYVASHDLQEPLRKVSSFVQLFAKRYAGQVDETGQSYLNFAVDGAHRMQRLIDDLLHYSRVSRGQGDQRPVDLERVYTLLSQDLSQAIAEAGATLECGALPVVLGEPVQMHALLQNLIGNALKYHKPGRAPLIRISAEVDADGIATVHVQDNGIGIEQRFFDRIFVIFQRLHNRIEYPGSGIGLAICKRIVENHGGRLWLESTPGEGSTFHFTITTAGVENEAG